MKKSRMDLAYARALLDPVIQSLERMIDAAPGRVSDDPAIDLRLQTHRAILRKLRAIVRELPAEAPNTDHKQRRTL